MEHIVPLPEYDVLAYLIAGFVAIAACDLVFGTRIFFRTEWGVSVVTIIVIAAYISGHVVTALSTVTLENYLVNKLIQPPFTYLMAQPCYTANDALTSYLAPWVQSYFSPLECNTQNKINEKLRKSGGANLQGAEMFWEAYNSAKQNDTAYDRITTFHKEFDFCRNLAFVLLVAALVVLFRYRSEFWKTERSEIPKRLRSPRFLLCAFFLVGIVFFVRYAYFYRVYAIEVLTSYAYAAKPSK